MEDAEVEHLTRKQKQEDRIVERVLGVIGTQEAPNKSEELTQLVKFMRALRVLAANALLAAMLAAVYEYFALMGVSDMSPARAVLFGAWVFGALLIWDVIELVEWRTRRKALTVLIGFVIALGCGFYALDRWTIAWKLANPPGDLQIQATLSDIKVTVHRLTGEDDKTPHWTPDAPAVKEINAVPGYLKIKIIYDGLPVEQASKPTRISVAYYNRGSTYTHESTMRAGLFYVDFHGSPAPEPYPVIKTEARDALAKLDSPRADIAPGEGMFNSYETGILTEDMVEKLKFGTARIYLFGFAEWTNQHGSDHVNTCLWLQPSTWTKSYDPSIDVTKTEPVWHEC